MRFDPPVPGARLMEHDPETGTLKWFVRVSDTHDAIITQTPVDDLLDANAEAMNASIGKRFGEGQRVASIPMDVYYDKLLEPVKQHDQKYIARFLNDSDNSKFRTFRGKI